MELMIVIFIIAIILGYGVPSFTRVMQANQMSTATNDLVSAIHMARTEAVKRRAPVSICTSPNPLAGNPVCNAGGQFNGYVVFVDNNDGNGDGLPDGDIVIDAGEQILRQQNALPGTMTISTDSGYLSFASTGFRRVFAGAGPVATTAVICDQRGNVDAGAGNSAARAILIGATGRPQAVRAIGDVNIALGITGGACP